jgi:flagellar basal-body rod modification protein FlgD
MTTSIDSVSSNSASNISLQDFLQVLTTQLTYQDPLKPLDNQQFMAQIAQFTTLEQTQQMTTNLQSLVLSQAAQQSVGLIGHKVNITSSTGPLSGTVTGVDLSGSAPSFTVSTSTGALTGISLGQITQVQ